MPLPLVGDGWVYWRFLYQDAHDAAVALFFFSFLSLIMCGFSGLQCNWSQRGRRPPRWASKRDGRCLGA